MQINLKVTGTDAVRAELQRIGRQAPFAMSLALNNTANEAQRAIKDSLSSRFTLRRKGFVENTIYRQKGVDFATKTHLQASIRVNPARNFLAQHEEGGSKTPMSGTNVAIPLAAVQPDRGTVIPKRLRPSGLRMNGQVRKVVTPNGTFLVRNRPGKGRGQLDGWRTEFLYKLKRSVPIKPRLQFRDTATKAINDSFVRHALLGIDQSLGRLVKGLR